jgi:putative membrane protein insertion efficiency factor
MTRILLALIGFYRRWLSPALHTLSPGGCRYVPTCSEYALAAIATHGALRGGSLALWRVLRCNPFTRGGLDQVPPKACRDAGGGTQAIFPHEPLP